MYLISKLKKLLRLSARSPDVKAKDDISSPKNKNKNDNHLISPQNNVTMAIFNYGIGGNEAKVDANEAIQEIQENKTLLVSKLTQDDPVNPEVITGLKTVEDVFRYFNPNLHVELETAEGKTTSENFQFKNLSDFTPKSITQQSPYLRDMSLQQEQYNKIIRQLRSNKVLRSMLENEQTKEAFIDALKTVAEELNANKD